VSARWPCGDLLLRQASGITLERTATPADSVLGLTPEDLHDLLPFPWLRRVERLLLNLRKIALAFGDEHQLLDDEECQRLDIAGEIVIRCAVARDGRDFGGSSAPAVTHAIPTA
jgi:hypothetical protein